jgi:hypothetical protein
VTFEAEIVVRASGRVVQDSLYYDGREPGAWDEQDVRAVLTLMLLAVDRAATGVPDVARTVALRGLSWIVSPFDEGAAIAIEIPSGSVVAGPFDIAEPELSALVARAIALDAAGGPH